MRKWRSLELVIIIGTVSFRKMSMKPDGKILMKNRKSMVLLKALDFWDKMDFS